MLYKDPRERHKERVRRWRSENRDKARELDRRSREKNKEKRAQYDRDNRDKKRAYARKSVRRRLGCASPTGEQKSGPCEICQTPTERLYWDHDHGTGAFRGWLCRECNSGLGFFKDSAEVLLRAAGYLTRTPGCGTLGVSDLRPGLDSAPAVEVRGSLGTEKP